MDKPRPDASSVGVLLDQAIEALTRANLSFGHGTDNPTDEAVHLVLFCLGINPDDLDHHLDNRPSQSDLGRVWTMIERRIIERKPAAYLTGTAWLHGLSFAADERALVPRSLLVEALNESLPQWMDLVFPGQVSGSWPASVLDLCCGSGSIAIHAALRYPQARVTASDISADALSLCRQNVARHELSNSISIVQSDLFAGLNGQRFDLVLCNPPYVNNQSMAALPAEFLAEPDIALRGGKDGMDLVDQILHQVIAHLSPSGIVLLEIGHEAAHFEQRFDQLEFAYLPVTAGDQMVVALNCEQLSRGRR